MAIIASILYASLLLSPVLGASNPIVLRPLPKPEEGRQIVNSSFVAFSLEFFSFLDYTGNSTYYNPMNINCITNIRKLMSSPLYVRIGGSSQNTVYWAPNQTTGLNNTFAPGADKPNTVGVGPAFFEGFGYWPTDSQWVMGMPMASKTDYTNIPVDIVLGQETYKAIGDRLYAIELGNEINPSKFPTTSYVSLWLAYARNVSRAVWGMDMKKFEVGALQAPTYINSTNCTATSSDECYTAEVLLEEGIAASGLGEFASAHEYMADAGNPLASASFLMNHTNTMYYVDSEATIANETLRHGVSYAIGETNSFSGHGLEGVSDRFAAAVWMIDYIFYTATSSVSRLYFHQGTGWKYSAWLPIKVNSLAAGVKGPYNAYLFAATALQGGGKQVDILLAGERLTAYAVYNDARSLESIVIVNMNQWNSTQSQLDRPSQTFLFPLGLLSSQSTLRRLTAPGVDSPNANITWAGQWVNDTGVIQGRESIESVSRCGVVVKSSEAVLVTI